MIRCSLRVILNVQFYNVLCSNVSPVDDTVTFHCLGYPDYDGGSQVTLFAAQMIFPDNTTREVYKGHDKDCIVTGLLPGRPYLFQVRAFNRAGVSFLCFVHWYKAFSRAWLSFVCLSIDIKLSVGLG